MKAWRGELFHCLADPGETSDPAATAHFEDGILLVDDGKVVAAGDAEELLSGPAANAELVDCRGKLIMPGLIDCHVHFAQLDIVASYGSQLLEWLQRYAYPAEQRCADEVFARRLAEDFIAGLLANGTTTALVFGTVHRHSADAVFAAAAAHDMRLVAGKVLMDRDCPEALRDSAATGIADSRRLIEKWHGKGRLGYAITPRFALTSSDEQLAAAGALAAEYADVWVHTHLAENPAEVAAVAQRFGDARSYLDVYARHGLVRPRSVFAHCLHLDDTDRRTMGQRGAAAAFCPTSNLFLGSGLFDLAAMRAAGVRTGLATDVGGGPSLSLLKTAAEAYKVLQLGGQSLPPARAIWLATLGAAEALYLDDCIGNFAPGKEADFIVVDIAGAPASKRRAARVDDFAGRLFALLMLGDERNIAMTCVAGRAVTSD